MEYTLIVVADFAAALKGEVQIVALAPKAQPHNPATGRAFRP